MLKQGLILFYMLIAFSLSAMSQTQTTAAPNCREAMKTLAKKYEDGDKISSMILVKGSGLEMMKLMFRKEFGKDFIKGVNMIIIIEYSEATESEATAIRQEVEKLAKGMEQADLPKEDIADVKYVRNYFNRSADDKSLSDMIILAEDSKDKCVLYFGGVIHDDSIDDKE